MVVAGLGNPGSRYRNNRHNAGRMAAERLAEISEVIEEDSWREGTLALARCEGETFLILNPRTYMNLSGRPVSAVLKAYGISPENLIVIHDDIDIPLGAVKKKFEGGTAGHKGLDSIVERLGRKDFMRVRIGVGRPPEGEDPADYVLSDFTSDEAEAARAAVTEAADTAVGMMTEIRGEQA
jgi:PTH1 family peptidyl-tRNA hydrolase